MNETTTKLPENATTEACPIVQAYVDVFYIYVLGMGPVILTGFVTNGINIFVLRRHFNDINSFFLLQFLAVADIFFLLICFVYFPVRHLYVLATRGDEIMRRRDWEHAWHILRVVDPLFYVGQATRNWTVILITFERFITIVYPNFSNQHITRRKLIIIWVIIILLSALPRIEGYRTMTFEKITNLCNGEIDYIIRFVYSYSKKLWSIYYVTTIVFIPVILLWIMNITLIVKLRQQLHQKVERDGIKSQRDQELERQATRMVIGVLTVFTLLETPGCIDRIVSMAGVKYTASTFHFFQYMRKTALFLNVLHSAMNFWAYCVSNKAFRNYLTDCICRRELPPKREEGHEQMTNTITMEID